MQKLAIGNCLAQAEAFAVGYPLERARADLSSRMKSPEKIELLARHKVHEGGRPVSVLAFEQLDARTLGRLVAMYEHKVFAQSVIWGINAFDQWGVELGKRLCEEVLPLIDHPETAGSVAPALAPLLERFRAWRR
jgi:glucose-6-phosphate isomerase